MTASRYDDFEIALLVDRVGGLADFFRGGSGTEAAAVQAVLRELSHVLEVLQEPAAAADALFASDALSGGDEYMALVDDTNKVCEHFEVDDVEDLIEGAVLVPEDWTKKQVEELIAKFEDGQLMEKIDEEDKTGDE